MLRSLNDISGYELQGSDEEIGRCKDFLFEDLLWVIRYMVVDTNLWLPFGQKVLISPISLGDPDWNNDVFPINLSLEQVKSSPSLEEHQPISHQYESELFKYYGYGYYWIGNDIWGSSSRPTPFVDSDKLEDTSLLKTEDRHLRSVQEIKGYEIQTTDQKIGHIVDFIFNTDNWAIPYVVIDTNNWLPGGRKVIVSHQCFESVNWAARSLTVNLSSQTILDSPIYEPERLNDREYENSISFYFEPAD